MYGCHEAGEQLGIHANEGKPLSLSFLICKMKGPGTLSLRTFPALNTCDLTESEQEGFAKEFALRVYYQRLEVGHKHVVFLQSLHQWDLRSIKEWKSKERKFTRGRYIIKRWGEDFLMFLNFENLYKVPASFIEKEQTFTDIKNLFGARFGSTYTKIGMIQRRLAWPLRKDDTQIREAFHI